MNENKHGSRKLTPAISLKYGRRGDTNPLTADRGRFR